MFVAGNVCLRVMTMFLILILFVVNWIALLSSRRTSIFVPRTTDIPCGSWGELVVPFAFRAYTKQLTCQLIKLKGHRTSLPSTSEVTTAKVNEGDVFHCPQYVS